MWGSFIQNISLCAWSLLTLAHGARSVDKNCLVMVPRHEKWIWTKKIRLTAQAKCWHACWWWLVVGGWSGKAREGNVENEISWTERVKRKWAAWAETLFFLNSCLPMRRHFRPVTYKKMLEVRKRVDRT